jgi:hypothetical protein
MSTSRNCFALSSMKQRTGGNSPLYTYLEPNRISTHSYHDLINYTVATALARLANNLTDFVSLHGAISSTCNAQTIGATFVIFEITNLNVIFLKQIQTYNNRWVN